MSANTTPGFNRPAGDQFAERVEEVVLQMRDLIRRGESLNPVMEDFEFPLCLKSAEKQVLATNSIYTSVFGWRASCVGRTGGSYLNDTIKPVADRSDDVILSGCESLDLTHEGVDGYGRRMKFRAIKRSFLGAGHPRIAIFLAMKLLHVEDLPETVHDRLLLNWEVLKQLDARDKEIARLLCLGLTAQEVGQQMDLSKKTIEVRRASILRQFELDNTHQLARALVRLQDAGYCDFGY